MVEDAIQLFQQPEDRVTESGDAGILPELKEPTLTSHQAMLSVSPGVFSEPVSSYNKTETMFGHDLQDPPTSPREALVEDPQASEHSLPAPIDSQVTSHNRRNRYFQIVRISHFSRYLLWSKLTP